MAYIVDLRKAGQTIADSIRGALFATNKLRPHLEKLLQDMSITGPKPALAKLSKETDIDELKNLADILMQSITIDSSNMVALYGQPVRDIEYIEDKRKKALQKQKNACRSLNRHSFYHDPGNHSCPDLIPGQPMPWPNQVGGGDM
jgi:hypothetical protein